MSSITIMFVAPLSSDHRGFSVRGLSEVLFIQSDMYNTYALHRSSFYFNYQCTKQYDLRLKFIARYRGKPPMENFVNGIPASRSNP